MQKNYKRLFLALVLGAGILSANAQDKPSLKPQEEKKNSSVGIIKLDQERSKSMNSAAAIFKKELQLNDENTFDPIDAKADKLGFTHQVFQQTYKNVPVEFAKPTMHLRNGTPISISGEFYKVENLDVNPKINKAQAFQMAIAHIGASKYMWESPGASKEIDYKKPEGELVVLPVYDREEEVELKLAYKYDIFATKPLSRGELYMDANTGKPLFYNSIIKHATDFGHVGAPKVTARTKAELDEAWKNSAEAIFVTGTAQTRYSGTQSIETTLSGGNYTLNDVSRKVYTRDAKNQAPGSTYPYINNYDEFTDNDNNWTTAEHSANKDNAALDAHWGAMKTHDYWIQKHNRDSYDGNGAQIRSYVHVDVNYDNAFWNGSVMSYGDGTSNGQEGNGSFDALTSIDVAAHEIGHAVCSYTADLAYQRESGGLNEGFSDIWGAAVEHFAKGNGTEFPDPEVWLIGDEIDRRSGSAALRSMSDPKSQGQPDTYGGTYWQNPNCGSPTRFNDYCGVHTNSGVLNHWFYLAVMGGSGSNDVGDNYTVTGIGITKAANISYRMESQYLSSNSTYANARSAAIQSAIDLYGAGSQEEETVTNAWYAVNVGNAYSGGGTGGTDYCSSQSNNVNDEYISRVQLGSLDNTSGAQFYSDFTNVSVDLAKGSSNTVTITPTWTGTVYSEGYAVWIDYDQNGSFGDAGELVYSRSATTAASVGGSFTVPSSAIAGATRMRVSMKYNGVPSSCETFTYGEVEDYTINIIADGPDTEAPSAPANLSASNVTETSVDLSWNASTDNVGVTEYEVYQDGALLGTVTGTTATVNGLTSETTYAFYVIAKDTAGNSSAASNTLNVTTDGGTVADTQAPSAPTGLSASNIADTTVDLSWNAASDNVGVTGYNVYMDGSLLGSVAGTTANITGLTAGTTYTFAVSASDDAGNTSAQSGSIDVTTTGGGSGGTDILLASYFENGWDGWQDGGSDVARYSGSRSPEGSYSIRLRDNSGAASAMTSPALNLAGYDTVELNFSMYAYSMENGEDFWIRYNDGSGWQTIAAYARGTHFNNNTFYTASITLSSAQYNLTNGARFRFQNDASANGDHVYIDAVVINGISGAGFNANSIAEVNTNPGFAGPSAENEPLFEGDFNIYPNPVDRFAAISLAIDIEDEPVNVSVSIYDLRGSLVMSKMYNNLNSELFNEAIDVSKLQTGVYTVEVNSSSGMKEVSKLIKQ